MASADELRCVQRFARANASVCRSLALPWLAGVLAGACLPAQPTARVDDLRDAQSGRDLHLPNHPNQRVQGDAEVDQWPEGSLARYIALAYARSPVLRAAEARVDAQRHRSAGANRWPEPMIGYAYTQGFPAARGAQRHRVGVSQELPWPTRVHANVRVAKMDAAAEDKRRLAAGLLLRRDVVIAYWQLWLVRTQAVIQQQQIEILRGLAETVRGRVATGSATLAELQQVDITSARLLDDLRSLREFEQSAAAELCALVAAPMSNGAPTLSEGPTMGVPEESAETLVAAALAHPNILEYLDQSEAFAAQAERERADRWPGFALETSWMGGAPNRLSMMSMAMNEWTIGLGLKLPLWQSTYAHNIRAAMSNAAAVRAEADVAKLAAEAALAGIMTTIRDADRRVDVHRNTLLPQAESLLESVLGAYATGQVGIAEVLLAQRELLELHRALERARVEHAVAWARLEQHVARPVLRRSPTFTADQGGESSGRHE